MEAPPVAFTFIDVSQKKGLNEDMALLALFWVCSILMIPMAFAPLPRQIKSECNTAFALKWLPLFAIDQPTHREVKDCEHVLQLITLTNLHLN